MKISKDRLKELVQEELAVSFGSVAQARPMEASQAKVSSDGEGYMAKQNLWKIAEYAASLYELMEDNDCLEPWVEEKLAVAAYIMDSVGHYIEYQKHRSNEQSQGDIATIQVGQEPEQGGYEMNNMSDDEYENEEYEEDEDEEYEFDDEDEDGEEEYDEDGEEESYEEEEEQ